MTAPKATRAQLLHYVERAIEQATSKRPVVIVHADPTAVPEVGQVAGRDVTVAGSRSPLAIRRLLREEQDGPLVVLTDCDPSVLGDDVLVRTSGHRVVHLDRWATVCQLFGAERPAPDLIGSPRLADALIESAPLGGYPKLATRVLDHETATAALVRTILGVPDDIEDLAGFLPWASSPDAAGRVASARLGGLLSDLTPTLRSRFGVGVDAVLAALAADRSTDLVPLGLVAGAVYTHPADDVAATVRFDERLGGHGIDHESYRAWGAAAADSVARADDLAHVAGWLERASVLLRDLNAAHLAERSDLLPDGFDQRVRTAAVALAEWSRARNDAALAAAARAAIARVRAHHGAQHAQDRLERLRMVERLLRRGSFALDGLDDLATAATSYEGDGAWLDAARVVVSRGDPDPVLDSLCAALTAEADAARAADAARFARVGTIAAEKVDRSLVVVEDVLDRVVAPLARVQPVLLVVLDGLGWPTFTQLVGELEGHGWAPWRRTDDDAPGFVGVAVLPTVTECSRTSLLAGRPRTGDADSEQRAFRDHPGLLTVTGNGLPPVLFHKRDLRVGGLDTMPKDLLDEVADPRRKIVGLVLNNIDERLKDVAQPTDGWGLRDLDPLRLVLDEARRVGRAVVITADHGHVLDRDAEARAGAGGGERWRLPDMPAGEGEILVHGPRVVTDDHRAVLATAEQLRYGPRRNGYHGGLTPQELFVPVVVLSVDDLPESSGWVPAGFRVPSWWRHMQLAPATAPSAAASRTSAPPADPTATPTLFDAIEPVAPEDSTASAAGPEPAWIDRLLASEQLRTRRANRRVRVGEPELRRLLAALDATSGAPLARQRLAELAELPVARIDRYLAQLQDLLNVDGYAVVSVTGNEVRFDRPLLERQFSL